MTENLVAQLIDGRMKRTILKPKEDCSFYKAYYDDDRKHCKQPTPKPVKKGKDDDDTDTDTDD